MKKIARPNMNKLEYFSDCDDSDPDDVDDEAEFPIPPVGTTGLTLESLPSTLPWVTEIDWEGVTLVCFPRSPLCTYKILPHEESFVQIRVTMDTPDADDLAKLLTNCLSGAVAPSWVMSAFPSKSRLFTVHFPHPVVGKYQVLHRKGDSFILLKWRWKHAPDRQKDEEDL